MSDPKYSILITSRNEGRSLQRTVDDVLRHSSPEECELIVMDDASTDDSLAFLEEPEYRSTPIEVFRNDVARGLICSRARLADLACGCYLVFLDAHCAVSPDWLARLERRLVEVDGKGIAVPVVYRLDPKDWSVDRYAYPHAGCSIINPFLDFGWVNPQGVEGRLCTCTIGGMAWMSTQEWYVHIGKLDAEMICWGGENIDIALRTWVAGGWCVVAEDTAVGHLYRKEDSRVPDRVDRVDLLANKIRAAHSVFEKETFQGVLTNLQHVQGSLEALRRLYDSPGRLPEIKDHVESVRQRSDEWIVETFRLPLWEAPFFHSRFVGKVRGPLKRAMHRERPLVSLLVTARDGADDVQGLVASLLKTTPYKNLEVTVATASDRGSRPAAAARKSLPPHPRLGVIDLGRSSQIAENVGGLVGGGEYFALLDDRVELLEKHWIEKFILLFERHPRLALACPRTRWVGQSGEVDDEKRDSYDLLWDWREPGFSRVRRGRPLARSPYQALSCPETLLFFRREAFFKLGGFDERVPGLEGKVKDLAIRAWLSGYEVFCHPGISVGRRTESRRDEPESALSRLCPARETVQILPAVKYFRNDRRVLCCYRQSPRAGLLLQGIATSILRERPRYLEGLKFDDDWLFCKFGIEEYPAGESEEDRLELNEVMDASSPGVHEASWRESVFRTSRVVE